MRNKAKTLGIFIGAAGAAALTVPSASNANANTVMIQQADPEDYAKTRIRNGVEVLRQDDEAHTPEQASFAFDPVQKNVGIVVMMNTGRLDGPAGQHLGDQIQVGNIQGACMPINLVQDTSTDSGLSLIPDVANFRYVSQRDSETHSVVRTTPLRSSWPRTTTTVPAGRLVAVVPCTLMETVWRTC
jgi:hypothetical protein